MDTVPLTPPSRTAPPRSAPPSLAEVLPSAARQVTALQGRLDERARLTFARWNEAGVPPSAWTVARVDVALGLAVRPRPKSRAGERTELRVSPARRRLASIRIGIRFLRPDHVVEGLADGR